MTLTIDNSRLSQWLEDLARFSEVPAPAVTRILFSPEDIATRNWLREIAESLGLTVRTDAAGNTFFRWEGTEPDLPAVATGSHCDAIPNAGKYDGTVGVLGGLEALSALRAAGFTPRRSLEVILFTAEEPTRFGIGCLGSRLLSGALTPDHARGLRDREGHSLDALRTAAGCQGELEDVVRPAGAWHSFVELHIEQGPLLEADGLPIGLVEHIAGPSSYQITLTGEGGHAGAVLMPDRHDAALAAAEIALAVEHAALTSGSPDTVATTGVLRIEPGAVNSIPHRAWMEIDLRDTALDTRQAALQYIRGTAAVVCARRGVRMEFVTVNEDPPAPGDPETIRFAEEACAELGLPCRRMVSRAYHDSLFMSRLCPTTMIFIPCAHGWSHRPEEYAAPEAIAAGVSVLAHTLARLSLT